jgi:hypothetical protein
MDLTRVITELGTVGVPATMTSACALILLGLSHKASSIAASVRKLNAEIRSIEPVVAGVKPVTSPGDAPSLLARNSGRLAQLRHQSDLLKERVRRTIMQIKTVVVGIIFFLTSSLMLLAGQTLEAHTSAFALAAVAFAAGGVVMVISAMAQALVEYNIMWHVISHETEIDYDSREEDEGDALSSAS